MELINGNERIDIARELFNEYTDLILAEGGEDVEICLSAQNYEHELDDGNKRFAPPDGHIFIATVDGRAAGCAALAKLDSEYCELKRLYVRSSFRSRGVGRALTEKVIESARLLGYKAVRLDTFPFMKDARSLYEAYGFKPIEKYNDNPAKTLIYMELVLDEKTE